MMPTLLLLLLMMMMMMMRKRKSGADAACEGVRSGEGESGCVQHYCYSYLYRYRYNYPRCRGRSRDSADTDTNTDTGDGAENVDAGAAASPAARASGSLVSLRRYPRVGYRDAESDPARLTSVQELRDGLRFNVSSRLKAILRGHVFVGVIDGLSSLVQYRTQLYVVSHNVMVKELFYQQVLLNIGSFFPLKLSRPLPLDQLLRAALRADRERKHQHQQHEPAGVERDAEEEEDGDEAAVAEGLAVLTNVNRRAMLSDYFSIVIDDQGRLAELPDLLPGYMPLTTALPALVYELANTVDWTQEQQCFETVAAAMGQTFGMLPRASISSPSGAQRTDGESDRFRDLRDTLQLRVFPAFKNHTQFFPPAEFLEDRVVVQVTALETLYKNFERTS